VIVGPAVRGGPEANEGFVLRTGYTYSGHPLECVAALTCIEIQEREGHLARATEIGIRLSSGLNALRDEGLLTDVRGEGAVWRITIPQGVNVVARRDALLSKGVIICPIPPSHLTLCPPFVITDEQIGRIVDAIGEVLRP
jgi:putrescine aminotransferase